jgi:hypothetical protein
MNFDSLIDAASFHPQSLEAPDAWVGHLPFAAWVIRQVAPAIFVELGTHSGNSYFSFCQGVVEGGLVSKGYAVDTWQGDEHAGQYSDAVFHKVHAHHQAHYDGFSRLLRTTFDEAVGYFTDGSVELLHIDGLHTYDAVRHDFETWLPKLAPGAVVIFHDTNVRERNFGVWKLWEELQALHPGNLEFVHSNGLGVLQLSDAPEHKKLPWLYADAIEKRRVATYFAGLGERQSLRFALNQVQQHANQLVQVNASLTQVLAETNASLTQVQAQSSASLIQVQAQNEASLTQVQEQNKASLTQLQTEYEQGTVILQQAHAVEVTQLGTRIAELSARISVIEHESRASLADANREIAARDITLDAVYRSTSWRLMHPFRVCVSQLRRLG